jgi:hypothetical protein
MGRLNAMCRADQDVEDRIFALLGEMKTPLEIVDDLGLDGEALVWKVIEERDTPNGIAIREGIERLAAIRI